MWRGDVGKLGLLTSEKGSWRTDDAGHQGRDFAEGKELVKIWLFVEVDGLEEMVQGSTVEGSGNG